ncbi:MAG: RNA 2',3'-cyclic phosphodiesterase [Candidatus Nealsonbacteria bacterium CG_4_8_14_3_um_filter_39_7]|uniref:RNA 2',3'-cyclic phosphodiesterase n=1 Tax=Candidatus Nealsonbacteria bacterium CG23_combo_of_CG06-09_8_20_14_all_39_17 TaxID=1974722 RepID=A0A2G9YV40_9BACT|nr:MAG: RNA 2',3'-cyclic phosphodiesterase [Candidatus Nealsonbacteria bacterium CG23_combo_of_CG06-09_8_20_14_all_39_17]PIU43983.1 MAG: RNA 2',3'-cyclic phosphodiesterase [Candidatus Nealsonbacteria bacterium CG07_land_8_20_14_0_80_39_13]PIW91692.1 MAG: RNA 2',3'-cyclic phosphodiesterase [Candidatus Nealsonbacteria bacterium CG_4_8_14_3_um_filter_39_7]
MKKRTFVAINLPEKIREKLVSEQKEVGDLFPQSSDFVRWAKKDNLHITLSFIGSINDEEILEICEKIREITKKQEPFSISLNKIIYGPPGKNPRMIWAMGEKSPELAFLRNELEKSSSKPISPHITLGRIKAWQFDKIELEERPEISKEIFLDFEVSSLELMESELKKTGPEYTVLESFELGKDIKIDREEEKMLI